MRFKDLFLTQEMRKHVSSCGKLFLGNELRISNEGGNDVPNGIPGKLYIRNNWLIDDYYNNQEATKSHYVNGFLSVGDIAIRDEEGYYYIVDRKNDMVISGGVKVYSVEIERVIKSHPNVKDVAVVGLPDDYWRERIIALVIPKKDKRTKDDEIIFFCKESLADYKCPKTVFFTDEIPRSPQGKTLKRGIRQEWAKKLSR